MGVSIAKSFINAWKLKEKRLLKMKFREENSPWVLVDVAGIIYAIPCDSVLSLEQLSKVTPLPTSPAEVRGVVNFRGKIIELLDTRILLNSKAITEEVKEFCEMIDSMLKAHLNWVNTLEDCILNGKEFTLTTDPHKCAFGKWYDNFKTNDSVLSFQLAKFDKPHKAIHQIGITAVDLLRKQDKDGAIKLINATKDTELQQMVHLFAETKIVYEASRREILVVLGEDEQHAVSISVDEITAIEHLSEIDYNLIKETVTSTEYLTGVGKRKDGSAVFIINEEYLLKTYLNKPNSECSECVKA